MQHAPSKHEEIALIWYTAIEEKTGGFIKPSGAANKLITGVRGETPGLDAFDIKIYNHSGKLKTFYTIEFFSPYPLLASYIITLYLFQKYLYYK